MLRWILLGALVVALTAVAAVVVPNLPHERPAPFSTQTSDDGDRLPYARVDQKLTYDFGTMSQRVEGTHTWRITNDGDADLLLKKGPASCSCMIARMKDGEELTLAPGQSTEVELGWTTRTTDRGAYGKSAEILTNDPGHPVLKFGVAGFVYPPIETDPDADYINFQSVPGEEGAHRELALRSRDRPDLEVRSVKTSRPDLIAVTIRPLNAEEMAKQEQMGVKAKGYVVEFTVQPSRSLGSFYEQAIIETDHPNRPQIRLGLIGRIIGPIAVRPEAVDTTATTRGKQVPVVLFVTGQDETHFTPIVPDDLKEKLKATVEPVDESPREGEGGIRGRSYRLTIVVPPGVEQGTIAGTVLLKTDHPKVGQIEVPVTITVRGN